MRVIGGLQTNSAVKVPSVLVCTGLVFVQSLSICPAREVSITTDVMGVHTLEISSIHRMYLDDESRLCITARSTLEQRTSNIAVYVVRGRTHGLVDNAPVVNVYCPYRDLPGG